MIHNNTPPAKHKNINNNIINTIQHTINGILNKHNYINPANIITTSDIRTISHITYQPDIEFLITFNPVFWLSVILASLVKFAAIFISGKH